MIRAYEWRLIPGVLLALLNPILEPTKFHAASHNTGCRPVLSKRNVGVYFWVMCTSSLRYMHGCGALALIACACPPRRASNVRYDGSVDAAECNSVLPVTRLEFGCLGSSLSWGPERVQNLGVALLPLRRRPPVDATGWSVSPRACPRPAAARPNAVLVVFTSPFASPFASVL
jgi:hypothetical protein